MDELMRRVLKWVAIAFAAFIVIGIVGAIAGGGNGDGEQQAGADEPATSRTTLTPPADETRADPPEPEAPESDPEIESDLNCDYILDFEDFQTPDHRFVGGGTIENTGNVGAVVRVTISWDQLGTDPVRFREEYRVLRGQEQRVQADMGATSTQINRHQSADAECNTRARIVDTFGTPQE